MKKYESPTIEQAGGNGEMGTWLKTETLAVNYNVAAALDVVALAWAFLSVVALTLGSPPSPELEK